MILRGAGEVREAGRGKKEGTEGDEEEGVGRA